MNNISSLLSDRRLACEDKSQRDLSFPGSCVFDKGCHLDAPRPFLIATLTVISFSGGKTLMARLSCFWRGMVRSPCIKIRSKLDSIDAANAIVSKVTMHRPRHVEAPPSKGRQAVKLCLNSLLVVEFCLRNRLAENP